MGLSKRGKPGLELRSFFKAQCVFGDSVDTEEAFTLEYVVSNILPLLAGAVLGGITWGFRSKMGQRFLLWCKNVYRVRWLGEEAEAMEDGRGEFQ